MFLQQFLKFRAATTQRTVAEAKAKIEKTGELGKVSGFIFRFLSNAAEAYGFIQYTIDEGKTQVGLWQTLFGDLKGEGAA